MREYPYDGHQAIDVFLGAKDWPPEQKKAACLHLLDDLAQRLYIARANLSSQVREYEEVKDLAKRLNHGLQQGAYRRNYLAILTKASEQIGFSSKDAMALLDNADAMWESLNTTNRLPGYFLEEFVTISGLKCDDVSIPLSFMQLPKPQIDVLMDNVIASACEEFSPWEDELF